MVGMKARITPAGAGKTEIKGKAPCFARDHPRRCGENRFMSVLRRQAQGSPPQVRGKLADDDVYSRHKRITPAGAGKTHRGIMAQKFI